MKFDGGEYLLDIFIINSSFFCFSFYTKHNFPGVIGCIDCTHIAIHSPSVDDPEFHEHLYVNRKNYHSINVQLVSIEK